MSNQSSSQRGRHISGAIESDHTEVEVLNGQQWFNRAELELCARCDQFDYADLPNKQRFAD